MQPPWTHLHHHLLPSSKVKLGKAFCSVHPLIGLPYGSTVGVAADGRTLQQIPPYVGGGRGPRPA